MDPLQIFTCLPSRVIILNKTARVWAPPVFTYPALSHALLAPGSADSVHLASVNLTFQALPRKKATVVNAWFTPL